MRSRETVEHPQRLTPARPKSGASIEVTKRQLVSRIGAMSRGGHWRHLILFRQPWRRLCLPSLGSTNTRFARMSLLDRCPFDPADPEAQNLLDALGHLYPLATQAQRPISRAGIRLQDIALNDAMTDVWPRVLRAAANQGRLRALVSGIAADPNSAGHEIFARLAQTSVEASTRSPLPVPAVRPQKNTARLLGLVTAVLAVVALVAIGVVILAPNQQSGGEIVLEGYDSLGALPFMPAGPQPTQPVPHPSSAALPVHNSGAGAVPFDGAEPGAYAGERDVTISRRDDLAAYLEGHPETAAALVEVLNKDPAVTRSGSLTAAGLGAYLRALTPVVLRFDIRVTDHGLDGNTPVPRQAVLQSGTAVLVDGLGVPRIRLAGGSPLIAMQNVSETPQYLGVKWNGFDEKAIAAMRPTGTLLTVLVLIDLRTGVAFDRPVGSIGDRDTERTAGSVESSTSPVVTTAPPTTSLSSTATTAADSRPLDLSGPWTMRSLGSDIAGAVSHTAEGFAFRNEEVAGAVRATLDCVLIGKLGGAATMNCRNTVTGNGDTLGTDSTYSGTLTAISWQDRSMFRFDGVITAPIHPSLGQYEVSLFPG
ncbi:DUF6777 domain-containing protein [Nocardia sp. NPDC003183]